MIDMGVGDDDLLESEVVFADQAQDSVDVIARIDDHCFARSFVPDDGAIALKGANGDDFVDHVIGPVL